MTNPPELFDLSAEEALLGAVLLGGQEILGMPEVKVMRPSDFWDHQHRDIWAAIREVADEGLEPDIITVADELRKAKRLNPRDEAKLEQMVFACPSAYRAEHYAVVVLEWSRRRKALQTISDLGGALHDDGTFDSVLTQTISDLQDVRAAAARQVGRKLYTLADAYAPRDPVTHLVGNMFALPSLSIVYGAPGTLKSLLLCDMAICVAAGLPWLEPLPNDARVSSLSTVQVPVLWLDFDNGRRRMHERIEAVARWRGLSAEDTPFVYDSMPPPHLRIDGSNLSQVERLIQLMRDQMTGLLVVDNLREVSGNLDENAAEISQVLAGFRYVAEEIGSAVILIHHQRKASGFAGRVGETLRGHSSIAAALDLALLIERDEGSDVVTVKSTKSRDVAVNPFGAMFTFQHREGTEDLEVARFFGQFVQSDAPEARIERAVREVLESESQLTQTALIDAIKELEPDIGTNKIRITIARMMRRGDLEMQPGHRNSKLYSLPG